MINRVVLVGRLTRDAETRKTGSGITMATFTVACDRQKKKDDQESQADFIRCIAWRQSAEYMERYAKRGMIVGVDGRIQTGSYEKNGTTVYTTDVVCDNVRILSEKKQTSEARTVATESHSMKDYANEVSQDFG
ncbi:MAG: single-stranded DNA-binding protein, partial [Clostridiales bacterium]|nr:single-stranded DNA-binding protein [Clostridiales bacterium]